MTMTTLHTQPINDANRLGLDYAVEAHRLPYAGPIWDVHTHLNGVAAAKAYLFVARRYGVERVWSMTARLEDVDAMREQLGGAVDFIAVPDYSRRADPETFVSHWHQRIEEYAQRGVRICKFWAAPRGLDFSPHLRLDTPQRVRGMEIARQAGMMFMVHVADPDTWFATHYRDHRKYGTKPQQYVPFERLLDQFGDVTWIAAHMGGDPEHLDHLSYLLDRHPNLLLDCSATKWQVRELSKRPDALRDFLRVYAGRVLFGTDIVAMPSDLKPDAAVPWFDLYASRFWALRTLFETDYDGMSPIVDPDLSLVDPSLPKKSTAPLRGCQLDPATLTMLYHDAPRRWLGKQGKQGEK